MTYNVTIALNFNRSCSSCLIEATSAAKQAIEDVGVSSITLRAVPKCDHATPPPNPKAALEAAGQQNLLDANPGMNGFDSEGE